MEIKFLVKSIADMAIFLEFTDANSLDPDTAIQAQEQLASNLQMMDASSREILLAYMSKLAKEYPVEHATFLEGIASSFGLE